MKKWVTDIYFLSLGLVLFTLPFPMEINNYSLYLLLISWILLITTGGGKEIVKNIKNNKVAILLISFALLYGISALFRINTYEYPDLYLKDLELRTLFIFFPLVLSGISMLSKYQVGNLLRLFVLGITISTFVCLTFSLIATIKSGSVYTWDATFSFVENYFMYHRLTSWVGMHAVYMACYVSFAFFIVLVRLIQYYSKKESNRIKIFLFTSLLVYFLVLVFLLKSITISVGFLLTLILLVSYYLFFRLRWSRKRLIVLSLVSFLVISSFGAMMLNKLSKKGNLLEYNMEDEYPHANWNALNLRLAKWDIALQVLNDHWMFGVGPGRIMETLDSYYEKNNFYFALKNHYNPHDQFFHTFIVLGISGFALLISIFIVAGKIVVDRTDILMAIFLFTFTLFSLTESTLVVNKGVIFFCFFLSFFSYLKLKSKDYFLDE